MVEYRLAKARVAGSNPVSRFFYLQRKPLKRGSAVFYVQYNPYETGFIPPDRKVLERVCKMLFVRYYSPDVRHTLREILVPVQPA